MGRKRKSNQLAGGLEWTSVDVPDSVFMADEAGGFMSLEEIDGVDVSYINDSTTGGKLIQFIPVEKASTVAKGPEKTEENNEIHENEPKKKKAKKTTKKTKVASKKVSQDEISDEAVEIDGNDQQISGNEPQKMKKKYKATSKSEKNDISDETTTTEPIDAYEDSAYQAWIPYCFEEKLIKTIREQKFTSPTAIQCQVFGKIAVDPKCDIIGAAETGSGKTLAFGLPILQRLATRQRKDERDISALILAPTRELCVQIKNHLQVFAEPLGLKVACVFGGMSSAKQKRLIQGNPNILVATPGRLWDFISEGDAPLQDRLDRLEFFVLDEADRMADPARFKELPVILKHIHSPASRKPITESYDVSSIDSFLTSRPDSDTKDQERSFQIFIFSATIDIFRDYLDQQKNSKNHVKTPKKSEPKKLDAFFFEDCFRGKKPCFVDVTQSTKVAHQVTETKLECTKDSKDLYLYYFLARHTGKTIVFVNCIDTIRRLVPLLFLLKVNAIGLHAQMKQKQRLSNLERFTKSDSAVLIATDVAARGLDIKAVDHVVHYNLPKSNEVYVHRSGRTARAQCEGLSAILLSPDEGVLFRRICKFLNKKSIPSFPIEHVIISRLGDRVKLAQKIETMEYKLRKTSADKCWIKKAAECLEIDLSDQSDATDSDREDNVAKQKATISHLRAQLKERLQSSILPKKMTKEARTLEDLDAQVTRSALATLKAGTQ